MEESLVIGPHQVQMGRRLIAEFTIFGLPKMTNAKSRLHWGALTKESTKWKRLVHEQCILARANGLLLPKAFITLTRYSCKQPDYDGLVSGMKHLLDGLKKAGTIVDDKPSVIGQPTYHWIKAPKGHGKVHIKIEV